VSYAGSAGPRTIILDARRRRPTGKLDGSAQQEKKAALKSDGLAV